MIGQEQVEVLKTKHQELDTQLSHETTRPFPDEIRVAEIKREKLRIKDELASMNAL